MQYKCDQCEKYFPSKAKRDRHVKRVHERGATKTKPPEPVTTGAKEHRIVEQFEVKKPELKFTAKDKEIGAKYHCVSCGGTITHNQNPCPHCGAELDWSQV